MLLTRLRLFSCLVLLSAATVSSTVCAAERRVPHNQDRPPGPALSPDEAIEKMTVPEGFTVEVVAAEPDIVNPVAMTFDERGRIWICESVEYPRRSPGKGRDRIKVLEDTDGDGKADKVTVFAEGLNIPSGIAVGHGGVWVANAPDVLFLQDTDGDGKADKSEVVVTGFGRDDTHELPNSFTWGPDGWLYGLNGVFNRCHVKYPRENPNYAAEHPGWKFTCAMFRIHPRTREFQVFAEGTSNPWGIAFDRQGSAFISACVIDHLWHITETGYYHRQGGPYPPHTWKIGSIVQHKHQKAAYCGLEFFDSDVYPEEHRGRLYMGNIHGNCINVDELSRDGSTYLAKGRPDFLTANDAWFMPVAQKTGPDGCLYILDWYDRYHCYQDANRDPEGIDRLKGRLYRVRYKDAPRVTGFDLAKASDEKLIELLGHDNVYFRDVAQRLLAERNDPAGRKTLKSLVLDTRTPHKKQMHALWALAGGGPLEAEFHLRLLSHPRPMLRAWGVRLAGNDGRVDPPVRERVVELAADSSPDVLLQVAIASRKIEGIEPVAVLTDVLVHSGDDKLIPHIVWQNLHPLLEQGGARFVKIAVQIPWSRTKSVAALTPRIVERLLGSRDPDFASIAHLLAILDLWTADGPYPEVCIDASQRCLTLMRERIQNGEIAGKKLTALRTALRPTLAKLLTHPPESPVYLHVALLTTTWKDPAGMEMARRVLTSTATADDRRLQALQALIAAGDPSLLEAVEAILSEPKEHPPELRGRVLSSLGRLDDPRVAEVVLASYAKLEPELKPRAVELLTQRAPWSKRLLAAIGKGDVPANALNLNQVRGLLATGDEELAAAVRKQWGTIRDGRDPEREKLIAEMKRLIRTTPGDPFAGEKVFEKVCAQCHTMYGKGVEVGPDITLNGRGSFDQLLSNVFDPSLVIGAAYQPHIVVTDGGRVLTGLLAEDGKERVVLKVQGGKLETIPRGNVEIMKSSEVSMMPEELEKQLKPHEISDLFAFLTLDKHPGDKSARRLPGVYEVEPRQTKNPKEFGEILAEVAPGFGASAVGEGGLALLREHAGRSAVVQTHPLRRDRPCVLHGRFDLPAGKQSQLVLSVSHHPQGDWQLVVKINGRPALEKIVGQKTTTDGWAEYAIDLSHLAGKPVKIELHNAANDWRYEYAYWGRAAVVTE